MLVADTAGPRIFSKPAPTCAPFSCCWDMKIWRTTGQVPHLPSLPAPSAAGRRTPARRADPLQRRSGAAALIIVRCIHDATAPRSGRHPPCARQPVSGTLPVKRQLPTAEGVPSHRAVPHRCARRAYRASVWDGCGYEAGISYTATRAARAAAPSARPRLASDGSRHSNAIC